MLQLLLNHLFLVFFIEKGSLEGMSQRMKLFYFTGSCHESVQAQEQIRSNFVKVLGVYLQKSGQGSCSDPNNANICKADNVKIKCGKVQSRKRSTQVCTEFSVSFLTFGDILTSRHVSSDYQLSPRSSDL